MAKLINPLFSLSASGKLGGIVYMQGINGQNVRVHIPQTKKPTAEQKKMNYAFGATLDAWRLLSEAEKYEYNQKAANMKMTGMNLFVKENFHNYIPE